MAATTELLILSEHPLSDAASLETIRQVAEYPFDIPGDAGSFDNLPDHITRITQAKIIIWVMDNYPFLGNDATIALTLSIYDSVIAKTYDTKGSYQEEESGGAGDGNDPTTNGATITTEELKAEYPYLPTIMVSSNGKTLVRAWMGPDRIAVRGNHPTMYWIGPDGVQYGYVDFGNGTSGPRWPDFMEGTCTGPQHFFVDQDGESVGVRGDWCVGDPGNTVHKIWDNALSVDPDATGEIDLNENLGEIFQDLINNVNPEGAVQTTSIDNTATATQYGEATTNIVYTTTAATTTAATTTAATTTAAVEGTQATTYNAGSSVNQNYEDGNVGTNFNMNW